MSKRIFYTVQGKVQGVFFRDFTETKAKEYGLTGWVKNASDGTVQCEAQGDESSLQKFAKDLNSGPKHAHVTKVIQKEIDAQEGESEFSQ